MLSAIPTAKNTRVILAQALAAYLPELMVADLLQAIRQPDNIPLFTQPARFEAITMMVDITGFTPLCEALARKGREGAEHVTDLINDFFSQALGVVQRQGGIIAKFGGDAFTAFFRLEPDESWETQAIRALHSALALQNLMRDYAEIRLPNADSTTPQVFRLSAKVGISAGSILIFGVGIPEQHCDFHIAGTPFTAAADAEHHARAGEIIVHADLWQKLNFRQNVAVWDAARDDCYPLLALNAPVPPSVPPLFDLVSLTASELDKFEARAVAYVPPSIYERLKLGYDALPGEHRRVVSLFVNVEGFDWVNDVAAPANFARYYLTALEQVQLYGGHLNRISSGDKGDVLHILFGAPVAHQDDDAQAVRCACALQKVVAGLPFVKGQKIGLSTGFAFAGEIGSPQRHEYTVIGDTVNLSARLMQMATNRTVLLDETTAARLRNLFGFAPVRPVQLKGKQGFIGICEVEQEKTSAATSGTATEQLYGRETELNAALNIAQAALTGQPGVLALSGEPGIGKSVLLARVVENWQAQGGRLCAVSLQPYERSAFKLWGRWLAKLLEISPQASASERRRQLHAAVNEFAPALADWTPLWGELLDLDITDDDWLRSLDPALRRQRLAELTPVLLAAVAERRPLLLLCDDFHWADSASLELLEQLVARLKNSRVLVAVGFRREQRPAFGAFETPICHEIKLSALSPADCREFIEGKLGEKATTVTAAELDHFIATVIEMTGGNPFFIEELLGTLQAENLLTTALSQPDNSAPLSYNLQGLIMARLDRLDNRLREIILAAAVVGGRFSDNLLKPLLPPSVAQTLNDNASPLQHLHELDLLRPAANGTYHFRHALIGQVAYDSLPFAHRRTMHERVGAYFEEQHEPENQNQDDRLSRLAYHYERSANDAKAVQYLAQSAARATALFANVEAVGQYQTALTRAQNAVTPTAPDEAELLLNLGNAQAEAKTAGFAPALESYGNALEKTADPLRRAIIQQRRGEVLKRATRFDEALAACELAEKELASCKNSADNRPKIRLIRAQLAELYSTILPRQSQYKAAYEWAEKGLKLLNGKHARQPGAATAKIRLYQALAAAAPMLQQMDTAQNAISRALLISRALNDPLTEGELQLRQAILAMQRTQLSRARLLFKNALPLIEKTGARDRLAYVLLPGGETLLYRGEYTLAQQWLARGRELAEEINTPYLTGSAYYLLGRVAKEIGEWDAAERYYQTSAEIAHKWGLWDRLVEYLVRQGELAALRGNWTEAEKIVRQAIDYADQYKLPVSTKKYCHRFLSEIYYRQGNFEAAIAALEWGGADSNGTMKPVQSAMAATRLAECWALAKLDGKAALVPVSADEIADKSREAVRFFQKTCYKIALPAAWRVQGLLALSQNQPAEATANFKRGLAVARTLGNRLEIARLLMCYSQLQTGRTRQRNLQQAATLLKELGAQPEIQQLAKF
jgi:class 3 adenylate cyclase/tetratricopeptide (TPR) repeat protein